jgi:5-methylcytosine-specific restriction endonuclease McrA
MKDSRFSLMRVSGAPVSTDELLDDLKRVAATVAVTILTAKIYTEHGLFDATTISRRFGSWNKAMVAAGLTGGNEVNYSDAVLFENIMRLWEHCGRQPRRAELAKPPSTISQGPYRRRFRSWVEALKQFVDYANASDAQQPEQIAMTAGNRIPRDPSLRLRFFVLKRDDFRCRACGASPATKPGLHLHVDHIEPRSRGGMSIAENLQTLCEPCNLGKSNVL